MHRSKKYDSIFIEEHNLIIDYKKVFCEYLNVYIYIYIDIL